jgi:Lrp/AsnC family transcriptional regulator, leucine-responsive regulatory protein
MVFMPNPGLDRIDREILHHLQSNARLTNLELAERVNLSASPCLRRVKLLEERGIIRRYATLLDPRQVGLPISVFVSVSLRSQDRQALIEFERSVQDCPEVMECYLMTGTSDYLLRVVVPDLDAYETFLSAKLTNIASVANIQSSFSLKQVVYRTELPIPA